MSKKVFITGINGFIGSNVAKKFLEKGYEVEGLIRKNSDVSFIKNLPIGLYKGDIRDKGSYEELLKNIDIVVHVAGLAADWGPYQKFHEINYLGTKQVVAASSKANVKRFVYISTVAFHGFGKTNIKEEEPPASNLIPYAKTKWMAEQWLWEFSSKTEMEIAAIRPGNVFGPNDRTFMLKYIESIEQGKFAQINKGKAKTCPTFIYNLTDAIFLASTHKNAPNNAFIVTDGLDIDWNTFNSILFNKLGKPFKPMSIPYSLAMTAAKINYTLHKLFFPNKEPFLTPYRINNGGKDYHFSIEKIKKLLGFMPQYDIETALDLTVKWYKTYKHK